MRAIALFVSVLLSASLGSRASAYEERLELSIGAMPSLAFARDLAGGASVDLFISKGISDRWSLGASGRYSMYRYDSYAHLTELAFHGTWALDIVRWVPRITFGVGPALAYHEGTTRIGIGSSVRFGADRLTEFGLVGLDLRIASYSFLEDAIAGRLTLGVGFRIGWLLERF